MTRTSCSAAALLLVFATPVFSQTQATANTLTLDAVDHMPKANLSDVAWIAGWWKGTGIDAVAEELWSQAAGGSMMGAFRLIEEGEVVFYELMTIVPLNGSLNLVIKHFNNDLTGWESMDEVVEFPLVRLTDDEAYFDGLTYRKRSGDGLSVYVTVTEDDGSRNELEFTYERLPPPGKGSKRRSR